MIEELPLDADGYGCAAVICTAVARENRSLRQTFNSSWERYYVQGDKQHYHVTTFTDKNGKSQRVFSCRQSVMGMTAASSLATKAILLFRPRYLIMCGITAGIQRGSDQLFGDVLVPNVVWDYSTGKVVGPNESELEFGGVGFLPRPQSLCLDPEIEALVNRLCEPGACEFQVQTGPLACGTSVMANERAVDFRVRTLFPETVGLDMESYGIFLAASMALDPKPKAIVAKSVCDYANEQKCDEYQDFAAYTSSRFVEYLLTEELDL